MKVGYKFEIKEEDNSLVKMLKIEINNLGEKIYEVKEKLDNKDKGHVQIVIDRLRNGQYVSYDRAERMLKFMGKKLEVVIQ